MPESFSPVAVDVVCDIVGAFAGPVTNRWAVGGLRSIAHLAPASKGRCGIYVLVFADGEYYVGQTVDVAVRFTAHALTYHDIAEVLFFRVRRHALDRVERDAIHAVQKSGAWVRNVVHAAGRLMASPFDVLVPAEEQQRWLAAPPADAIGDEPRPDQAEVRRKGLHKYRELA